MFNRLLSLALVLMCMSVPVFAERIMIEGSTTMLPIAQLAAEEFMKINPDADISVRGGGSGVGIASLIDGSCDIADASRAIKDSELKKAVSRGIGPKAHIVAMDGIAIIVNKTNVISEISGKQLKDIFVGKISDWSVLGSNSGKIIVASRDTASGTYEAFGELALKGAKVRPDALMQASNQAVASAVAKTPGAIGYIGVGYINPETKPLVVDGIKCEKETVLSGKYPLSRPLFMYTNGLPTGILKEFLDFVKSVEGQTLTEEAGYIGIK